MVKPILALGLKLKDLDEAARRIGTAVGVELRRHHSDDAGFRYFTPSGFSPRIMVAANRHEDEEGEFLREPEYGDFSIIVDVMGLDPDRRVEKALTNSLDVLATVLDRIE